MSISRILLPVIIFTIFISSFVIASSDSNLIRRDIHFLSIPKTSTPPTLDGMLDDACWQSGAKIDQFVLTAGDHGSPAKQATKAWLCYDESFLYVAFICYDSDIKNLKSISYRTDDNDMLYDDRVEVFIDVNHDHRSYWELAVNPKGTQFDQTAFNRLHGSKTCDMYPEKNLFWRAKTKVFADYWTAELAINFASLGVKKVAAGTTWGFNLARARQPDIDPGEEFFKEVPHGAAEYSAWAPVNDYIRETISNFQAPIEFGDVVFGNPGFEVSHISLRSALYAFGPLGYPSEFGWNPLEIQLDANAPKQALLRLSVTAESHPAWSHEEPVTLGANQILNTKYWIPADLENHIIIQLLDAETGNQLYRTSYWELTPPFIEYDLETLYTRHPAKMKPVQFRLLMDDETRHQSRLSLSFVNPADGHVIARQTLDDLSAADELTPVFDSKQLRNLPGGIYAIDATLTRTATGDELVSFRQKFNKFDKQLPTKFGAVEGDYSYGGITDYGIRILFPQGVEYSFWKKASYGPWWDVDEICVSNEFMEVWGGGNQGCNEPMQDRETRYSSVELLENSDARVVVHWRYALSDPHYNIFHNEWVDEYYTMYPDGIGARAINLWPNSNVRHEMFEILLVKPPGIRTHQLLEEKFATLSNLDGKGYSNIWLNKHRDFHREFVARSKEMVVEVHLKDRLHPFTVFSLRPDLLPGVTPAHVAICARDIGHADRRGHWPASRFQIDGYNTPGLDVPQHGNIGNIQAEVDSKNQPTTWTFLLGVMEKGSKTPYDAARSWLYPADVTVADANVEYTGYDNAERAYSFQANRVVDQFTATLAPKKGKILNPVFLLRNAGKTMQAVKLGRKTLKSSDFKTGITRDGAIVVFVNKTLKGKKDITFILR